MKIHYFSEDCNYILKGKSYLKKIFVKIGENEQKEFNILNIVFCSDEYLREINKKYLSKDYYTDIITFPYLKKKISGDLFVSVDRIEENARLFHDSFENEMKRVLIHGVLHLCGYNDKTDGEKKVMREKENFYLNI